MKRLKMLLQKNFNVVIYKWEWNKCVTQYKVGVVKWTWNIWG